jgi:hypothetical protein
MSRSVISLILQIIALSTVSWSVLKVDKNVCGQDLEVDVGLWRSYEKASEVDKTKNTDLQENVNLWKFVQAMSILGVIVTAMNIYYLGTDSYWKIYSYNFAYLYMLLVVSIWGGKFMDMEGKKFGIGYSYVLYIVALVIFWDNYNDY